MTSYSSCDGVSNAMIQAAGLGTRLRPLTESTPKPLLQINGQSLLERAIDTLEAAGVKKLAVNTHYLPDQITFCLNKRSSPEIYISHEDKLLDTGGGIKQACDYLPEDQPLFCLSSDWYWEDKQEVAHIFKDMAGQWDEREMDILLLLVPRKALRLTSASGDYDLDDKNTPCRALRKQGDYMWTSVRLMHPRVFENTAEGAFSFLDILDACEAQGRLKACCLDFEQGGRWHHISTLKDYNRVISSADEIKQDNACKSHG